MVQRGEARPTVFDPAVLGIPRAGADALRGGDAQFNAQAVHDLLGGKPGPVRDSVLLNAAGALVAAGGPGDDLDAAMSAAYARATEAVDSGRAAATLERWVDVSRSLAKP